MNCHRIDVAVTVQRFESRRNKWRFIYALKGEHVDGHNYIKAAREAGASAALVSTLQDDELPQLAGR
ncbi:MAG: Mur ligase domain-containing protein [Gammaproteobacteria bacterium]|nr:Mur ligase domain-containing protein [Gammaproteobacteria bacterium]